MDPAFLLSEEFLSVLNPYLLQAEIAAAVLLGIGIVYESDKFPESVHESAFWFVVIGVVLETVFSVLLFASEEQIGSLQRSTIKAQQSQIIVLETRIAPRFISVDARNRISEKMKPFSGQQYSGMVSDVTDAWDIWREISLSLGLAGWQRVPPPGRAATHAGLGPAAGLAVGPQAGVMIQYPWPRTDLKPRAEALADALRAEGIAAGPEEVIGGTPDAIVIVIGPKPQ